MLKKTSYCIVALAILLPLRSLAYYLEGTVFGPDGAPVMDVLVKLYTDDRQEVGRGYSNSKGEYKVSGLPGGTFTLEAVKTGLPRFTTPVNISGPTPSTTVYFDVRYEEKFFEKAVTRATTTDFYLKPGTSIKASAMNAYRKGMKKLEKGKTEDALEQFQKAKDRDPSFSRAHTQAGILFYKSDRDDSAKQLLEKAAELNPSDPLPLIYLSRLALDEGDITGALTMLATADELDSTIPIVHALQGKAHYLAGNLAKAEFEFSNVLLSNPNGLEDTRLYLAEILFQKQRYFEARNHYQMFLREYPDHPDADSARKRLADIRAAIEH